MIVVGELRLYIPFTIVHNCIVSRRHTLKTLKRAKISALGTYVPPRVLTNFDLEKMVDTTNDWILERTGIHERHIADKGVGASDLAVGAVKNLVERHGTNLEEVEAIVVGTVTPDMMYPSTACLVQHKLNLRQIWGFDVSAGCSGFLYALTAGAKLIESGSHKKVLVIGSDKNSAMTDFTDRATCIIFGDGAGAVLLEPAEDGEDFGIIDYVHQIEGFGGQYLYMPGGGSLNPRWRERPVRVHRKRCGPLAAPWCAGYRQPAWGQVDEWPGELRLQLPGALARRARKPRLRLDAFAVDRARRPRGQSPCADRHV